MDYNDFKSNVYETVKLLFTEGVEKYYIFLENGEYEKYKAIIPAREEYTVNSRYLHRGYYCPSPLLDDLVDNTRKGKLHRGNTKRKKFSHRYLYNAEDKLYLVENYTSDMLHLSREFIWSETNKRYGLSFYDSKEPFAISIETFENGKLQSYAFLPCWKFPDASKTVSHNTEATFCSGDFRLCSSHFETYTYCNDTIKEWDFSRIVPREKCRIHEMVFHDRYIPIYENGNVISFEHVRVK